MAEKIVIAKSVRLKSPAPANSKLDLLVVWSSSNVSKLVVFPDSMLARCFINGREFVAQFSWYEPDPVSQEAWEAGGQHVCPVCGLGFQNSQGLSSHVAMKHPESRGARA